jgi:diguanylate cyclase (GGDEF)-like protein
MRVSAWMRLDDPAVALTSILVLGFGATSLATAGTNWTLVDADLAAAVVLVFLAALLPWQRLPRSAPIFLPLACDGVIAVLREAQGGSASGYAPLAILPVVWVGLVFSRRAVAAITAATGAMFGLPIALVGAPAYPTSAWRGCVLWTIVAAFVGIVANRVVAEQRRQRLLADERAHELDRLVATHTAIATSSLDLQAVLDTVAGQALELTRADAAVVELPEGDEMVYRAAAGTALPHLGYRLARRGSISGLALETREILVCTDSETDARVDREACRRVGARSIVVVPLAHGDEAAGVLEVYSSRPGALDGRQARLLAVPAAAIAAALVRADLMMRLGEQAVTDELTGLLNRRAWYRELELALARARRSGSSVSVVLLDVDGLKTVNDSGGHAAGDRLLRSVSSRWTATLRESDVLGRLGGDEFAVVLENADEPAARDVVERLAASLDQGQSASAGIAAWDGAESVDELVARADVAMYAAKRGATLARRA